MCIAGVMGSQPYMTFLSKSCRICALLTVSSMEGMSLHWCADIEIQANEILHHKLTLNGYLAEFTSQSMETITQVSTWSHECFQPELALEALS